MAEPLNTNPTTPTPPSTGSKPRPQTLHHLLEGVSSFLQLTTWVVLGLIFLFLGVICKIRSPIPISWEPFLETYIPNLPYFVCGFGFLCLAHARSLFRREYQREQKKDIFYPHAWKTSLLGTQVFFLYATGIYAILFGINVVPPIGMLGLAFLMICFFLYLLWYQIQYFTNRLPAFAALRIAIMAFVFSAISYLLWTLLQMIIPSVIMAFLAICAGIYSLSYSGPITQKGSWLKYIFMIATVALLSVIGYYVLDFWKPQFTPLKTVAVTQGIEGTLSNLHYSPEGNAIVFTQELHHQWFLQVVNPKNKLPVIIPLPGVDGDFHDFFVEDGKSLLLDAPENDQRKLLKVDIDTGTISSLISGEIEPFSGGNPWSASTHQFLFSTHTMNGFHLNEWTEGQTKTKVLYSSPQSILSPAWIDANDIAYVDGVHPVPYMLNIKAKTAAPVITQEDMIDQRGVIETDPLIEVLPSPDHFRYLCIAHNDNQTILWSMLMDGSKRVQIYQTNDQLKNIAWLPYGQRIIFEKSGPQRGFKQDVQGIVILNANLGSFEDLIPAQVNCHSPACSPNGVEIAFVGSEGLWYPSLESGIWVAVLR